MKSVLALGALGLLFSFNSFAFDSACGTAAGSFEENADNATVGRRIERFKKGDHYEYAYALTLVGLIPEDPYITSGVYTIEVTLNGRHAVFKGRQSCTTANNEIGDGRCADTSSSEDFSNALFFYAANGDHLNVWEGEARVLHPTTGVWGKAVHYRFASRKFSELKF